MHWSTLRRRNSAECIDSASSRYTARSCPVNYCLAAPFILSFIHSFTHCVVSRRTRFGSQSARCNQSLLWWGLIDAGVQVEHCGRSDVRAHHIVSLRTWTLEWHGHQGFCVDSPRMVAVAGRRRCRCNLITRTAVHWMTSSRPVQATAAAATDTFVTRDDAPWCSIIIDPRIDLLCLTCRQSPQTFEHWLQTCPAAHLQRLAILWVNLIRH